MSQTNPTSRTGQTAHGSSCKRFMHVHMAHIGRKHRRCAPTKIIDSKNSRYHGVRVKIGPSKCIITAGVPPQQEKPS